MFELNFTTAEPLAPALTALYADWSGATFDGVLTRESSVTVLATVRPTSAQMAALRDSFATGEHVLVVTANKAALIAGGADTATILCNHPILASDVSVRYEVRYTGRIDGTQEDNALYASGTAAVESGVVTLTLAVDFAGEYRVFIRRNAPSLHFGGVLITATEA